MTVWLLVLYPLIVGAVVVGSMNTYISFSRHKKKTNGIQFNIFAVTRCAASFAWLQTWLALGASAWRQSAPSWPIWRSICMTPLIKQANGDSYDEIDYSDNPRLSLLLWWLIHCLLLGLTVSHAMMIFLLIVPVALLLAPKDLNHHVLLLTRIKKPQPSSPMWCKEESRLTERQSCRHRPPWHALSCAWGRLFLPWLDWWLRLQAWGACNVSLRWKTRRKWKGTRCWCRYWSDRLSWRVSFFYAPPPPSLMISFWPEVTSSSSSTTTTSAATLQSYVPLHSLGHPDGSHEASSLTEPLLPPANHPDNDEEQQQRPTKGPTSIGQLLDTTANVIATTEPSHTNTEPTDLATTSTNTTSRSRGTRRLLSLAAPKVLYLYAGCTILLLRLPFSLSIPYFLSTTLTAVTRGQCASANAEILALLGAGKMDAILNLWCVFFSRSRQSKHC